MRQTLNVTALLALVGLSGPALALALAPAAGNGPVLVLAAPWTEGAAQIIRASGGTVVGARDTRMAAFATTIRDEDGFSLRLRANGAWHVVNGAALAALCGGGAL